jgi:Universal stress protein family
MALDAALETGARLIIANMLALPAFPLTVMLAPEYATLPHEEDLDAVRAVADRAARLGVQTELLRVSTPTPVKALLALVRERRAGLLVFGPDRTRLARWRLWTATRTIRRDASCLVWIAPDG